VTAAPAAAPAESASPAPEPASAAPAPALKPVPASPEYRSTGVTTFPAQPAATAAPKPERVVITSDQLVAAVQGKLQAAAEKAVNAAIGQHLTEAVRQAISKVDDVCKASLHQIEQHSEQRLDVMMRAAREDVLSRIEVRLAEDRARWEETHQEFR